MPDWNSFFAVPTNITVWDILNSQFLTTLFAAIVSAVFFYFERRVTKAVEATEDLGEVIKLQAEAKDKEAALEETLVQEPLGEVADAEDYRLEASGKVQDTKDFLEEVVTGDQDRRRRKTYENIPRHDYTVLALALHARGRLTADQLSAAMRIFSLWNLYGRGKAAAKVVPKGVLRELRSAYTRLATP